MCKKIIYIIICLGCIFSLTELQAQDFFTTEKIRKGLFEKKDKQKEPEVTRSLKSMEMPEVMEAVVSGVTDSESVWVSFDNEREFKKWTYKLSPRNLNHKKKEIKVWLRYVSPKRSVSRGKAYNDWFKKKVAYELGRNFYKRRVRIEYKYLSKAARVIAVLHAGKTNINVWLVRNGWSFYLLEEGESPDHLKYVKAEKYAREHNLGLWKTMEK